MERQVVALKRDVRGMRDLKDLKGGRKCSGGGAGGVVEEGGV